MWYANKFFIATGIFGRFCDTYSRNESYDMKKIRNFNTWNNTSYKERALYQVFAEMTIRAKNAGIPDCILEEAKFMYKEISETKYSRGENRKGIIASCFYMACKNLINVLEAQRKLLKYFKYLQKHDKGI